jgi:DNA-binding response OmpR family regulator
MANKRILIIEDDEAILRLYENVLKTAGFDVMTASDGKKGLETAQTGGFGLVLLDVMLPNLDGLGVLAELKKHPPQAPNGPTIILTNLTKDPILKQAQDLGAQDILTKVDFNPDQLVAKINSLMGV